MSIFISSVIDFIDHTVDHISCIGHPVLPGNHDHIINFRPFHGTQKLTILLKNSKSYIVKTTVDNLQQQIHHNLFFEEEEKV